MMLMRILRWRSNELSGVPRLVEKGGKGWRQKRERKLRELAPKFCAHGYKPVMERLVNRVTIHSRWL